MEKIKEMIKRGERGERMRRFIIDAYYFELIEKHERDELLQLLENSPNRDDTLVGCILQSREA
jgi:hypothetical protein